MTADEIAALETIRALAAARQIALEPHTLARMAKRGAGYADVRRALMVATVCVDQRSDAGRTADWRVTGTDRTGDELSCAVSIRHRVVVVTIF